MGSPALSLMLALRDLSELPKGAAHSDQEQETDTPGTGRVLHMKILRKPLG